MLATLESLAQINGRKDRILEENINKGTLSITCNGHGLRRDFAPLTEHGFAENVLPGEDFVMSLSSIKPTSKPTSTIFHRIIHDGSIN